MGRRPPVKRLRNKFKKGPKVKLEKKPPVFIQSSAVKIRPSHPIEDHIGTIIEAKILILY